MTSGEQNYVTIFRQIGSIGLIIFERDGTLIGQTDPSADFMLSDVVGEFVEMLRHLRALNIRFGFISDDRGMKAGEKGELEFAKLSSLLDGMLAIRSAKPDFWATWSGSSANGTTQPTSRPETSSVSDLGPDAIQSIVEWYEVDKHHTVFVGRSATGLGAAASAGIRSIGLETASNKLSSVEPNDFDLLLDSIQEILGLSQR